MGEDVERDDSRLDTSGHTVVGTYEVTFPDDSQVLVIIADVLMVCRRSSPERRWERPAVKVRRIDADGSD